MPVNLHWPPTAQPPELTTHAAHVWAVPLDVSQRTYDGLLATLAPDEQTRANEFRFDEPRRRYVVARGALRRLLGQYLDVAPPDIALTADEHRKPHVAEKHAASTVQFNVSHSGELAVIGFATGCKVGVDVEQLRDVHQLEQIARRFFHPSETNAVLAAPEPSRNLNFLRCWTGKEAVLKAVGTGILANLAGFQVPVEECRQGWIECATSETAEKNNRCWLEQLNPCNGYVAAIACVEANRSVNTYAFTM